MKVISLIDSEELEKYKMYEAELYIINSVKYVPGTLPGWEIATPCSEYKYNIEDVGIYPTYMFITLAEFRQKQINELLNN